MPKKTVKLRENSATGQAIKILIEFCIDKKIEYPIIEAIAEVSDGSRYKLTFERIDFDENVPLKNKEL